MVIMGLNFGMPYFELVILEHI